MPSHPSHQRHVTSEALIHMSTQAYVTKAVCRGTCCKPLKAYTLMLCLLDMNADYYRKHQGEASPPNSSKKHHTAARTHAAPRLRAAVAIRTPNMALRTPPDPLDTQRAGLIPASWTPPTSHAHTHFKDYRIVNSLP